jgi:hypothetical protein
VGFLLRTSRASLERRLEPLRAAGLIEEIDGELRLGACEDRSGAQEGGEPMSGAERSRRWRERQSRDAAGDAVVTPRDASEKDIEEKESETDAAPAARASEVSFSQFWQAFPKREGDNAEAPARTAWRKAIAAGEQPITIIAAAKAYANSMAGRDRRYIASAVRWLGERRWQGETPRQAISSAAKKRVKRDSQAGEAWEAYGRSTLGKGYPWSNGHWWFENEFPPTPLENAA